MEKIYRAKLAKSKNTYSAAIEGLPVLGFGNNKKNIEKSVRAALEDYILALNKAGEPVPEPVISECDYFIDIRVDIDKLLSNQ